MCHTMAWKFQAKVVNIRTAVARSACNFYALSKRSLEQLREEYATLNQCMLRIEGSLITEFDLESPSRSGSAEALQRSPYTPFAGDGGDGGGPSSRGLDARMRSIETQVAELKAETGSKLDALVAMMIDMQASTAAIHTKTTTIEDR
jgi:hypothetical protein